VLGGWGAPRKVALAVVAGRHGLLFCCFHVASYTVLLQSDWSA